MAIIEDGANSGRKLAVNSENAIPVSLTTNEGLSGFVRLLDSGGAEIFTTENGALNTSTDSLLFYDQIDGSAVDLRKWNQSSSGMTIAQTGGYITLNSGAVTTASSYAILSSIQNIQMYGHLPLRATFNLRAPLVAQANMTMEFGIGAVATTSAPTDGVYFRMNSAGEFRAIINNGSETSSAALTQPSISEAEIFDIVIVEDQVQFLIGDELIATVAVPPGQSYPTSSGRLPVFMRVYTSGSAPAAAPQLQLGQMVVAQEALNQQRDWRELLSILGGGAYQSPVTAFGQTANHANSTSPTSATLSNTAAGYTTLGGRYQFAAAAGAATDFALFGFQVPSGYRLVITGITVTCLNAGAIGSAITPTIIDWALGINSSAVSLATADGAGTWAPRRIPIGMHSFGLSAFIGQAGPDIIRTFDPALTVDSGRFFHVIAQVPVGAATASQIMRGDILVNGYFE